MYKLYDYFRSSASYRVRIILNYKNIAYGKAEVHLVNNGGEQHGVEYKQINRQGLVPTLLDTTNGTSVSQSLAIIELLEEKFPQPSIFPKDANLRATARSMAYIIACDTHPLNNLRVLQYLESHFKISDTEKMAWYHHWLKLGFDSFEFYCKQFETEGHYALGAEFTLADACLVPQVYNALRFDLPMESYPRIMAIYEHCLQHSFVDEASP